jgi:hypothetical protein
MPVEHNLSVSLLVMYFHDMITGMAHLLHKESDTNNAFFLFQVQFRII